MICPACKSPNVDTAKFCGSCGRSLSAAPGAPASDLSSMHTVDSAIQSAPSRNSLNAGAVFADRYEVQAAIETTPAVESYLARDRVSGSDVILKLVRADGRFGAGAAQQCVRQAAVARDIRNPAIAAVYDVGEAGGQSYFTAELVEGVSLRDWNRRRLTSGEPLGMSAISALIFAILDAITTIHLNHLVADLSASKVMLLSDPAEPGIRIKLIDVGMPLLSAVSDTADTGIGANPYRAPEALTVSGDAMQASADIYSISMIFYELLTGVTLAGLWQAPSAERNDVPAGVDALIQAGLSNAPRRRPQTVEEFRQKLTMAIGSVPGDDPKPRPKPGPDPDPEPDVIVKTWKIPDFLAPILKTLNMPFAALLMLIQTTVGWFEVLAFSGRPLQLGARRSVRAGLTMVVVAVLAVLTGLGVWGVSWLIKDRSELEGGPAIAVADVPDHGGDDEVEPEASPERSGPPVAPVEPVRSPYASFNGYWTDDFGDTWTMGVDPAGRAQGKAVGGYFAGLQMIGGFNGPRFDFAVGNAYGSGGAVGMFDGGCHIRYQTLDPYGSGRVIDAQLHVNHQPGAPCP
jgi:hypothetical protein